MSVVVINLGLKSIRCIAFDESGKKLISASRPVHTQLRSREVEQDANEWLNLCRDVVAEASSGLQEQIDAVTVTTSASCLVPVDELGRPTHPVLMVSDSRSVDQAEELRAHDEFQDAVTETGLPFTPDLMLPKLLWLRRHAPKVFDSTKYFLSPGDFLGFHLTGHAVIDTNNALKFHAVRNGVGEYTYHSRLLSFVGVDEDRLPVIAPPGTTIGTVTREAAGSFGLRESTKVILGTYDALCALVGSGVATEGLAAVVSGTVTSVRALAKNPVTNLPRGILRSEWIEPTQNLAVVGGSNNLGGGLIEWHKQAFYYDVGGDPYALMDRESTSVPPGSGGLLFLPYLLGERAPVWDSEARGIFFGLDRRHTRCHFTRAVFESVGFSTRHILEHIESAVGKVAELRFSGGLARIPHVAKIQADILQAPVCVPSEFETTALGAHILAECARGNYATVLEACEQMVSIDRVHEPDPNVANLYNDMFDLYKQLYADTRLLQKSRNSLLERFSDFLDSGVATRENL